MFVSRMCSLYQERIISPSINIILNRFPSIKPNQLTIAGCIAALVMIIFAFLDVYWAATLLLLLAGYLDTIDGPLARISKNESNKGAFLDLFSDRFVEFCAIFALYSFFPNERSFFCVLLLGALMTYLSSYYLNLLFSRASMVNEFGPSWQQRLIMFGFFVAMMLIPPLFAPLALILIGLLIFVIVKQVRQFLMS